MQVVLVYLQPFRRNSVLKCLLHPKIAKKITNEKTRTNSRQKNHQTECSLKSPNYECNFDDFCARILSQSVSGTGTQIAYDADLATTEQHLFIKTRSTEHRKMFNSGIIKK